jgi:phosphatidylserine decarboxylase
MAIHIVERKSEEVREEVVYGDALLQLVYKETVFSKCLCTFIAKLPVASYLFGLWQKTPFSKRQINPFVKKFLVDLGEAERTDYANFNDFFVRKLKPDVRPISKDSVVAPADGRYLVFDNISLHQEIFVKGKKLSLAKLLGEDEKSASRYVGGSLLMARLAPPDYHRFHFPVDCIPGKPRQIGGYLFSVNPVALKKNISYLSENKRVVIDLKTKDHGLVSFIAVGATSVGTINFTYEAFKEYARGDEMGYFAFGASMCIALFEPGKLTFASDLKKNTEAQIETLCEMGQSLITPYNFE